jgi:ribose transport system ATP-binding protein
MAIATSGEGADRASELDEATVGHRSLDALLTRWGTMIGMLAVLAAIGIAAPDFLAPKNLFVVLKQGSLLAMIAIGLTAALMAGGFDMSVSAVSQFAANLASGTIGGGLGMAVGIGLAEGFLAGLLNAGLVLLFHIPPFVGILDTIFVAMGLRLLYNHGQALTLYNQPKCFFIGQSYIGPAPFIANLLLAIVVILHIFFKHTRSGVRMYAAGENLPAARPRGISRTRAVLTSFVTAGTILGFAGVVLAS